MLLGEGSNGDDTWTLHVDRSSNFEGSGLGLVLISPNEEKIEQSIRFGFQATNNETEFEALIAGLGLAKEMLIKQIKILSDSQLVINQIKSTYRARDLEITTYLKKLWN